MIDPELEHIYNVILSVFLGIICVYVFDSFFSKPNITTLYRTRNKN